MFAVILTGGKQYKVKEGDKIKVEMLAVEEGKAVNFDKVLMFVDSEGVKIGTPYVKDAVVKAKVIEHGRHKKITILKFKRRKHHMKHAGHRQYYTEVEIQKLPGNQPEVQKEKKAVAAKPAEKKSVAKKAPAKKTAAKAAPKKPAVKKATAAKKTAEAKK